MQYLNYILESQSGTDGSYVFFLHFNKITLHGALAILNVCTETSLYKLYKINANKYPSKKLILV